jgi:pyruvate,water dikinase
MINEVGGKALNLGIMSSGGLPVPGGFCIITDAYRLVVADRHGQSARAHNSKIECLSADLVDHVRIDIGKVYEQRHIETIERSDAKFNG